MEGLLLLVSVNPKLTRSISTYQQHSHSFSLTSIVVILLAPRKSYFVQSDEVLANNSDVSRKNIFTPI